MPQYAALHAKALARASDRDLYDFAIRYAQGHAMGTPTGIAGTPAGGLAAPGLLPRFPNSARLELGRQSAPAALDRRKALAASLARRTTESSRRRALNRILAGYGLGV